MVLESDQLSKEEISGKKFDVTTEKEEKEKNK